MYIAVFIVTHAVLIWNGGDDFDGKNITPRLSGQ